MYNCCSDLCLTGILFCSCSSFFFICVFIFLLSYQCNVFGVLCILMNQFPYSICIVNFYCSFQFYYRLIRNWKWYTKKFSWIFPFFYCWWFFLSCDTYLFYIPGTFVCYFLYIFTYFTCKHIIVYDFKQHGFDVGYRREKERNKFNDLTFWR